MQDFQIAYMSELKSAWDQIVPNIPSQFKSDKYAIFPETYWLRAQGAPRAPNTRAAQANYHIEYGDFNCQNIELEYPLDDQLRDNFDSQLNADLASTRLVTQSLSRSREKFATSVFLQKGVWRLDFQPNVDGHGYWDADNSQPIKEIRSLRRLIKGTTGQDVTFLGLTEDVKDALLDNQDLIYRYNFVQGGILDLDKLAQAFGVPKVVVFDTVIDDAPLPASAPGFLASGQFLLGVTTPNASLTEPTGMACFSWLGRDQASGSLGNTIEKYRDEAIRSDVYRSRFACDFRVTAPSLGIYGYNCLTPKATPAPAAGTTPSTSTSSSGASTSTGSASTGSTSTGSASAGSSSSAAG